jgi:hypothetical protein
MQKIASPQELTSEIRRLLAYCEGVEPSRQVLASELNKLADRLGTSVLAADAAVALEKLHKSVVRAYNRLKKFYDEHLMVFIDPSLIGVGEEEFRINLDPQVYKLLDRLNDDVDFVNGQHVDARTLAAFKKLATVMLRDPATKEAGVTLKGSLARADRLMPDIQSQLNETIRLVSELGLINDPPIAKSLQEAKEDLRKKNWMWSLAAIAKVGKLGLHKPRAQVTLCPGSGISVTVSHSDIGNGHINCPHCSRPLSIRSYKENEDWMRTLPRHKAR